MGFVRKADIERHRAGCLEARVAAVREAAERALGTEIEVIATHADHAIVRAGSAVKRLTYSLAESGGLAGGVAVEDADMAALEGMDLDAAVAEDLRGVVAAMLAGQALPRTRVRDLSRMARRDGAYWLGEAVAGCARVEAPWRNWFAPQSATVREALHGRIREIEEPVPRQRFGKLPEGKLPEYAGELREGLAALRVVARGLFDDLTDDVAYQEAGLAAVHQSLRDEASTMDRGLAWLERMAWAGREGVVATAHDQIAATLRDALVVREHLRTRRSTDHGEESSAAE
jgi:hypothetical protein